MSGMGGLCGVKKQSLAQRGRLLLLLWDHPKPVWGAGLILVNVELFLPAGALCEGCREHQHKTMTVFLLSISSLLPAATPGFIAFPSVFCTQKSQRHILKTQISRSIYEFISWWWSFLLCPSLTWRSRNSDSAFVGNKTWRCQQETSWCHRRYKHGDTLRRSHKKRTPHTRGLARTRTRSDAHAGASGSVCGRVSAEPAGARRVSAPPDQCQDGPDRAGAGR